MQTAMDAASGLESMIANPGEAGPRLLDVVEGLADTAEAAMPLSPSTPLNVETGPNRGSMLGHLPAVGLQVDPQGPWWHHNDVVLEVSGDALGRYLRGHGIDTAGMELRAGMPSAVRTGAPFGAAEGNVFVILGGQLRVDDLLALERHATIADRTKYMKESGVATGVGTVLAGTNFLAPTILAPTSRLFFSKILFNLLITNAPGVHFPVYMYGSKLLSMAPLP